METLETAAPQSKKTPLIPVEDTINTARRLKGVVHHTPLFENANLSEQYGARILLKREDLQNVRSYKVRGAYNKLASLADSSKIAVCASAGNHAQGVAFACRKLGLTGKIVMPHPTPKQKVKQVAFFGKDNVEIILSGDTFDDAYALARQICEQENGVFIPPFDDEKVIEGQSTVGYEILQDEHRPIDYLILPVGGGGLSAGVGSYFHQISPHTNIIGVEPEGAPAMQHSFNAGKRIKLEHIDKFVDGASVQQVGKLNFDICRQVLNQVTTVPEGHVCNWILKLYNEEAIVVEPAGALSIAALDNLAEEIKGKTVVCVVSGGNNDITRMEEIKERALLHQGLKHYFIVRFPQRAGALREFVSEVLGPDDDISHFEYTKKNNRERGPALVGVELSHPEDYQHLLDRMEKKHIEYESLNDRSDLFSFFI